MLVLSIGGLFILGFGVPHTVGRYVPMMWRVGPVALGTSTALFLPLLRWAVGQNTNVPVVAANNVQTIGSGPEGL